MAPAVCTGWFLSELFKSAEKVPPPKCARELTFRFFQTLRGFFLGVL